jgi:hypothetical protein
LIVFETITIPAIQLIFLKDLTSKFAFFKSEMFQNMNHEDIIAVILLIALVPTYFVLNVLFVRNIKHHFFLIAFYSISFYIIPYLDLYFSNFLEHTVLCLIMVTIDLIPFLIMYSITDIKQIRYPQFEKVST